MIFLLPFNPIFVLVSFRITSTRFVCCTLSSHPPFFNHQSTPFHLIQTILGSGGAIGIPLAKERSGYTDHIRLVSRNPKAINPSDELFPINLHDVTQIDQAIAGSEVVYVTVGFEYNIKVWRNT